jgi:hypothetical protein
MISLEDKNNKTNIYQMIKKIIERISLRDQYLINGILYDLQNKNSSWIQWLKTVLNNPFLLEYQKEEFYRVFSILQRCRNAFSRFIHIIKYKKAKNYNTTDLFGDSFTSNQITIFENNTKYIFHLRELINIMNTALINSSHFFSEPIACKNPYTNIPFQKSTLYNIYFAIKNSSFIMPVVIQQYFLSNFDITKYAYENEFLIRTSYLESYSNNITTDNLRDILKTMFHDCHIFGCNIHRNFPNDRLLEIMRPYLKLYYKSKYSMLINTQRENMILLKIKLREFIEYNPNFGRKKIIYKQGKNMQKQYIDKIIFNDHHICFYDSSPVIKFMKSHLINMPVEYFDNDIQIYDNIEESNIIYQS